MNRNYENSLYEMDTDCLREQQRDFELNTAMPYTTFCPEKNIQENNVGFMKQCDPSPCFSKECLRDEQRCNPCNKDRKPCCEREIEKPICREKNICNKKPPVCQCHEKNNNVVWILLLLFCFCGK